MLTVAWNCPNARRQGDRAEVLEIVLKRLAGLLRSALIARLLFHGISCFLCRISEYVLFRGDKIASGDRGALTAWALRDSEIRKTKLYS